MESGPEQKPRVGFARRMLPSAVAIALLGAAGTGAHYYFKLRTEQLSRTLQYLEMQNTILQQRQETLHGQLQEGDSHIQEAEAALLKKVQEDKAAFEKRVREHEAGLAQRVQQHEAALADKVREHEAALSARVQHLSDQTDSFGAAIAVIASEHQRLRSAHAAIESEVHKYHARTDASLAQLLDDANRLVFEPEKHYAVLRPSGLRAYPIIGRGESDVRQERNKSSKVMHLIYYFVDDDFFDPSASLVDMLIYLSHQAEKPTTTRGKMVVHPWTTYGKINTLFDKEQHGDHAFVAQILGAAQRDSLPLPSSKASQFMRQLVLTFNNRAYTSFLTRESSDSVLPFLSYVEEPFELSGTSRQVSLAYEALAVVGAETFCPTHREAARTAFTALFEAAEAQKALGLGHYKNFGGSSFAERAASLATLNRQELSDVAAKALQTYKTK